MEGTAPYAGNLSREQVKDIYRTSYREKMVPVDDEGLTRPREEWPNLPARPKEIQDRWDKRLVLYEEYHRVEAYKEAERRRAKYQRQ